MRKYGALGLILVLLVALGGCEKKLKVEEEKFVSIHYTGTLADGTVFDSSQDRDPLEFIYGVGMLIPGLEKGLKGMTAGQKKTVKVKAEDAYGPYRDDLVLPVPREHFPAELEPQPGMQFMAQTMLGPIPVTIREVTAETVHVDYNAPLAGKELTFQVEVVSVRNSTEEELAPFRPSEELQSLPMGALPPVSGGVPAP